MTAPRAAVATGTLPVIELFHSIQGEGPVAGRAASFVRFAGCNLSCGATGGWKCDTAFSWEPGATAAATHMTAADIAAALPAAPHPVVITGGEPLLQQRRDAWPELMAAIADRPVWFETNGTIAPTAPTRLRAHLFVVSPKLPNAGVHRGRQNPELADAWRDLVLDPRVHGKYVVENTADVAAALEHAAAWGLRADRTWLMPQATTRAEHNDLWLEVAEAAIAAGVNATPRLHVLAWGTERGR